MCGVSCSLILFSNLVLRSFTFNVRVVLCGCKDVVGNVVPVVSGVDVGDGVGESGRVGVGLGYVDGPGVGVGGCWRIDGCCVGGVAGGQSSLKLFSWPGVRIAVLYSLKMFVSVVFRSRRKEFCVVMVSIPCCCLCLFL